MIHESECTLKRKQTCKTDISLVALLSLSSFAQGNTRKTDIDLKQSTLEWTGKKLGGEHYGQIQLSAGHLTFNKNKLTGHTEAKQDGES